MDVKLWGTRGSLATPGPEMVRYGGNTSCVGITGGNGGVLVLDAGTGKSDLLGKRRHILERLTYFFTAYLTR